MISGGRRKLDKSVAAGIGGAYIPGGTIEQLRERLDRATFKE